MTIAATSRTRVAFIAESTFGVTPSTPTFKTLRRTSGEMTTRKGTVVSDEIQLDRNVRSEQQVAQDPQGGYAFELSYGTMDDLLAAALGGVWSTNTLVNGSTETSFTIEETADLGASTAYNRFVGCEVDTLSLNFAARKEVTGNIAFKGQTETTATTLISGATYTAPNSNIIDTGVSLASLSVASLSPAPTIKNIQLNFANNLRLREKLGSLYTDSFGTGKMDITGSFDAYFESQALYQAILAHGGGSMAFTIGAVTNKKYTFTMPNIQFLSGARRLGGKNDDVMVQVPFRALYDGSSKSIQIDRAVA